MKTLFVYNPTSMDVSVDDLELVVKSGKTVDIYKVNPLLTDEKVEKSVASGSIFRRVNNKRLKIVQKITNSRPTILDQIRQSDKPMMIRHTKTSIVIEPSPLIEDEETEKFDFADYGVDVDKAKPPTKNANGSITIGPEQPSVRNLTAIKNGEDATDSVHSADKIINIETRVLDENGNEVISEASLTNEKAVVMQFVEK